MPEIPSLGVIIRNSPKNTTSLDKIIAERRLLKTKVKLLHIALFDNDLRTLNEKGLFVKDLSLADFRLTDTRELVVPIYDKIITDIESKNILESYLIYLSYLYNIDLLTIFKNDYHLFYEIIISIDLPPQIKMNIFELIKYNTGAYFSDNIELLNSAEIREKITQDERRLRRVDVN